MPKLTLDQTYIYRGKRYGPGQVEIEDAEVAKALTERGAAVQERQDARVSPSREPEAPSVPRRTTARKA
jgi:hypothetical protein